MLSGGKQLAQEADESISLVGQIGESKLKGEIVIPDLTDHKGKVIDTSKPSETFTEHALNEFVRDVAIRYVEDDDANITKTDSCFPAVCSSALVKRLNWNDAICWRDCGYELVDILLPVREFEAPPK
ncbi:hypothetical protein PRZ48_005257 [Zasmidium cellare]|uniref:Uncharacterized protein n=1 Tax=Zasmidium cellare TaxID=395010 RepID=A0ABR0ET13_ZASCE|nr:hypothetical protein PRZ48_005257 [Zasmidium cellare]